MRSILVGRAAINCSVLGFGCVKLTAQKSRAAALRTLEAALDSGITHFDVARLYGFGEAEGILGDFLGGKRSRVTVTTKFGLQPSGRIARHRTLMALARQIVRTVPPIERHLKQQFRSSVAGGLFSRKEAAASLDISLRELKTDYVDFLLMHEAAPQDARQPDLLDYLESEVKRGRIRAFGLASAFEKLSSDVVNLPAGCEVLQFGSSVFTPHVLSIEQTCVRRVLMTFGIMSPLSALVEYVHSHSAIVRAFSKVADIDFARPSSLATLLVDQAVHANRNGVTLVSSVSPEHVASNAAAAADASLTDNQRAVFAQLIKNAMPASHRNANSTQSH